MTRNINETMEILKKNGIEPFNSIEINIPNAEELFYEYFKTFLKGKPMIKAPEYAQVIEWLKDNKGKSLFLYGNNGRGKTFIATKVIPAVVLAVSNKIFEIVSAYDLFEKYSLVKKYKFLVLDDFGTEATEINDYGTKRSYINELIDNVEKSPSIYIFTSNLGEKEILKKYGVRTIDRIKGNFKRIRFGGENVETGKDSFR